MMLINGDNERTAHSIMHSASLGVHTREKEKSILDTPSFSTIYISTNGPFLD
jgi:hypothetical protein